MDVDQLAGHVIEKAATKPRFIIAIAGPPGAGKSTYAGRLNDRLLALGQSSKVVPMDGFHLDNSILKQRDLLDRKGAAETFDTGGFIHLMERLAALEDQTFIPVFDRERDIAIAGADCVYREDKFILVEGNYLLLKNPPWYELQKYWMETVFINPGIEVLEERLIKRWQDHGLGVAEGRKWVLANDIPNALNVIEKSNTANIVIG